MAMLVVLIVWVIGLAMLLVGTMPSTRGEWFTVAVLAFIWPFLIVGGIVASIAVMLTAKPSKERPISNHGWITKPD